MFYKNSNNIYINIIIDFLDDKMHDINEIRAFMPFLANY